MSDATTATTATIKVFGGKLIQSPSGFEAISWYQHDHEWFESLQEAEQWVLRRMDTEMVGFLGGMIRQLSDGRFVAVSNHQRWASVHEKIGDAEQWLLDQSGSSVDLGADWE
jgi:hypothetical protein